MSNLPYQYRDISFLAVPRPIHHINCRIITDGDRDQMDGWTNETVRADKAVAELALCAQVVVVSDAGLFVRMEERLRLLDWIGKVIYLR